MWAGFSPSLNFISCFAPGMLPAISKRTMMARKPNYDFERKERERKKAEKKALRAAGNKKVRELNSEPPMENGADSDIPSSTDP
jgi:hypothetical protein